MKKQTGSGGPVQKFRLPLPVAVFLATLTGLILWLGLRDLLWNWELESLSVRQRFFSAHFQDRSQVTPITLVTLDAATSQSEFIARFFGTSRAVHGYTIRFLRRVQPKAVIFDMTFNGRIQYDDPAGDKAMVDSLAGTSNYMSMLMPTLEPNRTLAFDTHSVTTRQALIRNTIQVSGIEQFPIYQTYFYFPSLLPPFPLLLEQSDMRFASANAFSFKSGLTDSNESGDARFWVPFSMYGASAETGRPYVFPTLPLAAVLGDAKTLTLSRDGLLKWSQGQLHLGPEGLPLIKWHGHGVNTARPVYPEFSYEAVLLSEAMLECQEGIETRAEICVWLHQQSVKPALIDPSSMSDRYIIIGVNNPRSDYDKQPTIYGPKYPGVYMQANALDNMLHDDFVLPAPAWLNGLALLLLPGLLLWTILRFRSVWLSMLMTLTLGAGYFLLSVQAYNYWNLWLYVVYPVLALFACFSGTYVYQYMHAEKERQQLRFAFGKYVSPAVMGIIERNPEKISLGGERREMSFLFCDIRGFTTYSDHHPPEEVQAMLTQYFSLMNKIILNRYQGSINKLIGDAIMAYWGFPLEDEDHAYLAVSAAMAMRDALAEWHADPARPPINIGIGINTGDAVIGNVGSEEFMDFTVIGDAVNVASRLEGMNKEFGTNILISASTHEKIRDRIAVRRLGLVSVRGKEAQVEVYEPLHPIS